LVRINYEKYFYCPRCVKLFPKDVFEGEDVPKCPGCNRKLRVKPKYHRKNVVVTPLKIGGRISKNVRKGGRRLFPAKPIECPECSSVSKRFVRDAKGKWHRYCSTCGVEH